MPTLSFNTSHWLTLGRGVYSEVFVGSLDGAHVCAVKRFFPLDVPFNTHALREIKYSNELSRLRISVDTDMPEPTESFTGVPRPLAVKYATSLSNEIIVAMPLLSRQSIADVVRHNCSLDMSIPVHAWLVQGIFVLANAQTHEILHRDIKAEHLLLNDDFSLALVDWGLSTKCPDNSYLTEYVTTYPYRPPEIFAYYLSFIKETSRGRHDRTYSFTIKPRSQPIRPYWCESDMYSFGMSIIVSLCQHLPFRFSPSEPFFHRQQRHMLELYKWHGLWPALIRQLETPSEEPSFARFMADHWRECFETKTKTIMCPFDSLEQALDMCRPKSMREKIDALVQHAYPCPWIHSFFDRWGPLLLTMCHLDPDERPNALSLLKSMHGGKSLDVWQAVTRDFFATKADIRSSCLHSFSPADVCNPRMDGRVVHLKLEPFRARIEPHQIETLKSIEFKVYNDQVDLTARDVRDDTSGLGVAQVVEWIVDRALSTDARRTDA